MFIHCHFSLSKTIKHGLQAIPWGSLWEPGRFEIAKGKTGCYWLWICKLLQLNLILFKFILYVLGSQFCRYHRLLIHYSERKLFTCKGVILAHLVVLVFKQSSSWVGFCRLSSAATFHSLLNLRSFSLRKWFQNEMNIWILCAIMIRLYNKIIKNSERKWS